MDTIIIGDLPFSFQRTYVMSDVPDNNFAASNVIILQHLIAPMPVTAFAWIRPELSQLQGKKHILSAIIRLTIDFVSQPLAKIRITEPVGQLIGEGTLCYANAPTDINIGIPDVVVTNIDTFVDIDISKVITDWVEGRRVNKGLFLKIVPPIPNALAEIDFITPRPPGGVIPILTVTLDPTVKPPHIKKPLTERII
jgi:hypothetical protein